jgi:hypothetical protein
MINKGVHVNILEELDWHTKRTIIVKGKGE